MSHYELIERCW